jgi:hypothetical protein
MYLTLECGEEDEHDKSDARYFLRARQPDERIDAQCLDGRLGRYRKRNPAAQSGTIGVGPLVFTGYSGDRNAFPTDHSRLRGFPARIVRG